jgi:hypothetical protein
VRVDDNHGNALPLETMAIIVIKKIGSHPCTLPLSRIFSEGKRKLNAGILPVSLDQSIGFFHIINFMLDMKRPEKGFEHI